MSSSGDRTGGSGADAGATVGAGHGSDTGAGAGATAGAGSVTAVPSKPRTFDVEEDRAAVMRLAVPFAGGAATMPTGFVVRDFAEFLRGVWKRNLEWRHFGGTYDHVRTSNTIVAVRAGAAACTHGSSYACTVVPLRGVTD